MASFEKRENGSWRVRIRGLGLSATFSTKKEAQAWAAMKEADADRVRAGGLPKKTAEEALIRYRDSIVPGKRGAKYDLVRIRAWLGGGKSSESALPFLDSVLSEISASDIAAYRDKRLQQVSPGTVTREMGLLSSIFSVARKEWGWVHDSPTKDVRRPPPVDHRKRRISADEIEAICYALGYEDGKVAETISTQVAIAFLLAIETAMRQGEILGLTWPCVSLEKKTATLPRTKNGSARVVPLSGRAIDLISLLPIRDDGRLFSVSSASCDALFRKAKGRAMIDDLHFHDTRREATSRLAKKIDVLTLAKITGHKDLRMLMIYYEEDMSSVANRLG